MGILFLPFLLCSLYFLVLGSYLGTKGVMLSDKQLVAFFCLLGLILVYHSLVFSIPFVFVKGRTVGQFDVLFSTFAIAVFTATTIGKKMKQRFEESQQPRDAFIGAVVYLSAGCTPISWFVFAKSLTTALNVKWTL